MYKYVNQNFVMVCRFMYLHRAQHPTVLSKNTISKTPKEYWTEKQYKDQLQSFAIFLLLLLFSCHVNNQIFKTHLAKHVGFCLVEP